MTQQEIDRLMMSVDDPQNLILGEPAPALTTMLYRVCGNDEAKFEESMRLVELFVKAALRKVNKLD